MLIIIMMAGTRNQQSDEFEYSYHDALEEGFDEYPGNYE